MKFLLGAVPVLIAVPLLVFAAVWQGKETLRWGDFPELDDFAARLKNVPMEVGSWKGDTGRELKADEIAQAGIKGYADVNFTNKETGEQVSMFIVCARLNDVSIHTPDRCYPANGYKTEQDQVAAKVELPTGGKVNFWTADFQLPDKSGYRRIYWSWSTDGSWRAPHEPREIYVRTQPVYKLYIESSLKQAGESREEGPPIELVKVLIPALNKAIFPDAPAPAPPANAPAAGDASGGSQAKSPSAK